MNHLFLRKMYVRRGSVDQSVDIDTFLFGGFFVDFCRFFFKRSFWAENIGLFCQAVDSSKADGKLENPGA